MITRRHRIRLSVCFVAILCLAGSALAEVRWRNGAAGAARSVSRAELEESLERLSTRENRSHVVLFLAGPIDAERRASLASGGVRLLSYLGDHAYFAALDSGLDAGAAAALDGLLDVQPVAAESKLHPDLSAGIVHPWSLVTPAHKADEPSPAPVVALYVLFHADRDVEREAREIVARHGGVVRSLMRSIHGAVVHLPLANLDALADEDAVMYVEPPLPRLAEVNDDNRARVGADVAADPPYGLDGSGVTVMVFDGGQMFAHGDFGGRLTIGASDTDGISDHATHVGGTIGGDGSGSAGQYRGMAPGVNFVSYGFEQEGGLQEGFLYTDPGDLEADYTEAITFHGADLSNNSIGTNTASNGFPCEWEGNYGATGALIDAIAARLDRATRFRIVWANGNERRSGACGTTYLTRPHRRPAPRITSRSARSTRTTTA